MIIKLNKRIFYILSLVSFGFLLNFIVTYIFSVPENIFFMRTILAEYLKYGSERKIMNYISYTDCNLDYKVETNLKDIVYVYGVCKYNIEGIEKYFVLALNSKSNIEFIEN